MSSLNLSGENKKAEKSSKVFTPNIYRKPIVKDEKENEAKHEASTISLMNYVPGNNQNIVSENKIPASSTPRFDVDGFIQKEAQLLEIRSRYESDILEYEEKQKELDELQSKFEEQEKALNIKCAILKSATERAKKAIPKEQTEKLEKEISAFEQKRSEFEIQVKEFESSRLDYEKKFDEYNARMEELSSLRSTYETEFEQYTQKKSELDEKCRYMEEKLSTGEELSIELAEATCPAAIEIIKSGYYAELKELNRKRADIETLKTELHDEESLLVEKRSSIEKIKEHIHTELIELGPKAKELETSIAVYEERVKAHEEKELVFLEKIKALDEKKTELKAEREELRLKHEENIKVYEEKELGFHEDMKALEARKSELEVENDTIMQKREENSRFAEEMEKAFVEMEIRRKELGEMVEKTNREIGINVTIHRQDLDIKKLNNKLEQQTIYIQSLETSVSDLKRSLEEARSDVKKNEVFSNILKQNMELIG
jgi:chromosome segregation ATPase